MFGSFLKQIEHGLQGNAQRPLIEISKITRDLGFRPIITGELPSNTLYLTHYNFRFLVELFLTHTALLKHVDIPQVHVFERVDPWDVFVIAPDIVSTCSYYLLDGGRNRILEFSGR